MEYLFTVKVQLAGLESDTDAAIERLGAAGCTDALVGSGRAGRLALAFSRSAETAEQAVRSALAEIAEALPDGELIALSPDLVGLAEAAACVGISRQALRKLMLQHSATFPLPVHDGSSALWHLTELFSWFEPRGYRLDPAAVELAAVAWQVNLERDHRRLAMAI